MGHHSYVTEHPRRPTSPSSSWSFRRLCNSVGETPPIPSDHGFVGTCVCIWLSTDQSVSSYACAAYGGDTSGPPIDIFSRNVVSLAARIPAIPGYSARAECRSWSVGTCQTLPRLDYQLEYPSRWSFSPGSPSNNPLAGKRYRAAPVVALEPDGKREPRYYM
jgi:hypothetical protein